MAEKNLEKCPTSFFIREMSTKTTLKFRLIPIRMSKINKTSELVRMWNNCYLNLKLEQPPWKSLSTRYARTMMAQNSWG